MTVTIVAVCIIVGAVSWMASTGYLLGRCERKSLECDCRDECAVCFMRFIGALVPPLSLLIVPFALSLRLATAMYRRGLREPPPPLPQPPREQLHTTTECR